MSPIYITPDCHQAIFRWSMCSRKEINVICFGRDRHITKVLRLRNVEKYPRHCTSYNEAEYDEVVEANSRSFEVIAEAHNHFGGPSRISKGDWEALPVGHNELVFCCRSQKLTAWQIQKTWKKTITSGQVPLVMRRSR